MRKTDEIKSALLNFLPDFFKDNSPSEHLIESLCLLYEHLLKASQKHNLVADISWDQYLYRHILDSLAPLEFIRFTSGDTVFDIGSGAGFPGIPLAIVLEDINLISIESISKKADYQQSIVDHLKLNNIKVINDRAETAAHGPFRETADKIVSRAVASIPTLLEYCVPFLRLNGVAILYKGIEITEELRLSDNALNTLNCRIDSIHNYAIPFINKRSSLIFIEKANITSPKYPRRAGIPHKRPL